MEGLLDDLVRRARRSGVLRDDVGVGDVILTIVANGGLAAAVRTSPQDACRRLTAHLLRAFRAPSVDTDVPTLPPADPLGLADVDAATPGSRDVDPVRSGTEQR